MAADHAEAAYIDPDDRVVGIELGGRPVAVPLNVLNFHEVVNLAAGPDTVAVSYCPLTGSSLVFDRSGVGGREFGVSGLLLRNNLVLFDRGGRTVWSQMMAQGICGAEAGARLPIHPSIEMTWDGWRTLHPETRVVSHRTGFSRAYDVNILEDYERPANADLLVPQEIDPRRQPKERVFGLPRSGDGGIAFPFFELGDAGRRVVRLGHLGRPVMVLWSAEGQAAAAYYADRTIGGGGPADLEAASEGFVDRQSRSVWSIDGQGVAGPRAGERLEPVVEAFVSFWFAWSSFRPETGIWTGSG